MGNVFTLFRREFGAYFLSPVAYVVMFVFYLLMGFQFYDLVQTLNHPFSEANYSVFFLFFGLNLAYWFVLLFVPAILTMRLLSEEYRAGTIEVLMTAPVTDAQVVLGKYLAALAFYCLLWAPTLAYVFIIRRYSGSALDPGPVIGGYLATLLVGALFLAVGLLASSLTRNQVVAAVMALVVCVVLFLVPLLVGQRVEDPLLRGVLEYASPIEHFYRDFNKGWIDTRPIVYYLSGTVACLVLTSYTVGVRKWR